MAEYTVVNLIALVVGVVLVANGYFLVRRGREAVALFVTSLLAGGGLIFVALFPNSFQVVATVLGLELKARAMLVIAILALFVLVTYLLNRIGQLYDRVSRLNERISLLEAELGDGRDD